MRFNLSKYDPSADSSPVTPALAKRIEGDPATLLVLDHTSGKDGAKVCESGSRKPVKNPKSRFLPGGDAALKGKLIRAHLSGTKVVVVADGDGKAKPVTAAALAKASYPVFAGWLDKAKARHEAEATATAARVAASASKAAERATAKEAAKAAAKEKAAADKAAADKALKADTTPGDQPDLNGASVTFAIGANTISGQVVKVEGDTATVEYKTGSGKDTTRKVKVAKLTVTD